MKTIVQTMPQEVQDKIMGEMVFLQDGIEQIALGNYALDFKQSYAFLGFTKNKSQVILGQITSYGATNMDGTRKIEYKKRYAKISIESNQKVIRPENGDQCYCVPYSYYQMSTDGFRYSEKIMELK